MKYFAYGSNCSDAVMRRKGVEFSSRQPAVLTGYRLLFNKQAMRETLPLGIGYANINVDAAGTVEGLLYEIDDAHLGRLDESERYPDHYTRIEVTVETANGLILCSSYQAQPDKIAEGLKPSREYLNHLLAAREFLSRRYYLALEASQTFSG